jgi:hypothetical protein
MSEHPVRATLLALGIVAVALLGAAAPARVAGPAIGAASSSPPSTAAAAIAYEMYDFFRVPYGEWWDYRTSIYGDLPMNAECFNGTSIADGLCTPTNAGVRDVPAYPYTNWWPRTGVPSPDNPDNAAFIYSGYRLRADGTGVGGYTLADPVFLPVLDPASAAGTRLEFDWRMQYLDRAGAATLASAGCPVPASTMDGYVIRSQVTLTMDLQESRRLFDVEAANAAQAATWWSVNADPTCLGHGLVEVGVQNWFVSMGGGPATVGTYDIANAFGYFYRPFYTQISATVDAAGVTRVTLDHVAWGTEVLLGRFFYWGSAPYRDAYLDSTRARGFLGAEIGWFEDLTFLGTFAAASFDFDLTAAVQYHFQHLASGGPNGVLDRTDDAPYWTWGPSLSDRTRASIAGHAASELLRYPSPPYSYTHATPGSRAYGRTFPYEAAPVRWDLPAGQAWLFRYPTGPVVFYDPNLTPLGANPRAGAYVEIPKALDLDRTQPEPYGEWDAAAKTWTVGGPASTGGPEGSAGPDGIAGTADDRYALAPWGAVFLRPDEGLAYLRVTTQPAVSGKILVDGVPRDEWGLNWLKLTPAIVTVSFGDVYGTTTPAPIRVSLLSGRTSAVAGVYQVHGSLRVTTNPALGATIYVNGEPANDWGMWRSAPAGSYTVSFGKVAGFNPPAPTTFTLGSGEFRHVIGQFAANPAATGPDPSTFGYLRVTTRPAVSSQVSVNGIPRDEWGLNWVKVAPGDYTISFKPVYGTTAPATATVHVNAGQTTSFEGVFAVHGSLRIVTSPAVPATVSVNGIPRNDWGMWQSMPAGMYDVSFGAVPGYTTPPTQRVTVASGALTTATGQYVASPASAPDASLVVAAAAAAPSVPASAVESFVAAPAGDSLALRSRP